MPPTGKAGDLLRRHNYLLTTTSRLRTRLPFLPVFHIAARRIPQEGSTYMRGRGARPPGCSRTLGGVVPWPRRPACFDIGHEMWYSDMISTQTRLASSVSSLLLIGLQQAGFWPCHQIRRRTVPIAGKFREIVPESLSRPGRSLLFVRCRRVSSKKCRDSWVFQEFLVSPDRELRILLRGWAAPTVPL